MPLCVKKDCWSSRSPVPAPLPRVSPSPISPAPAFPGRGLVEAGRQHSGAQGASASCPSAGQERRLELISGSGACGPPRLAGLTEVPCILALGWTARAPSLLALVENLQRRDLNSLEEATALGCSDRDPPPPVSGRGAARRIGKSQSAVANKLRLLRLPPDALTLLPGQRLHRAPRPALLRLEDGAPAHGRPACGRAGAYCGPDRGAGGSLCCPRRSFRPPAAQRL